MTSFIVKPTLDQLKPLVKVPPDQWHKFGIEYRSVTKDSSGFVTGGQLQDGRRFTLNQLEKRFQFTR